MQQFLEPARRIAWAVAFVAMTVVGSGCTIDIENKKGGGADPCSPNPCQGKGVCGDWTATCTVKDNKASCGSWKAKDGAEPKDGNGDALTAPAGWEAEETLCDGLDNDCDGLVDESAVGDAAKECAASAVGVCDGQTQDMACIGGKWRCEWPANVPFEASETSCDGLDNDCDGQTDEEVKPGPTTCKRMGVCAALPAATCAAGEWNCHYDQAPDYEEVTETKCDGKDNNCDGLVDSALGSLADGAQCSKEGVCSGGVNIACLGGKPTCDYAAVTGWQNVESQCDGKDNDCDGTVDNLAGSNLPLADGDVSNCAKEGVCKADSGKIVRLCLGGEFSCNYSAVLAWEATETLCDGLDNDCDGKVDGDLELPAGAASPCGGEGICAKGKAICAAGIWTCDWNALAKAEAWEAMEATCDGVDNDCDGQTDEDPSPLGNHDCDFKGVCQYGVNVKCGNGQPTCDYSHVKAYQPLTETSCDDLDNDCDGKVDEPEGLDVTESGCALGVCKGAAKATCTGGKWACSFDGVKDYEGKELTCDNKDNDCDGDTDEGLTDTVAAKCKTKGLCGSGVTAICKAGVYACNYPAGYEADEFSCDSKDNDCDGQVDEKACAAGKTCDKDASCATGSCAAVLGSSSKVCTSKTGQCVALAADGNPTYTDSGDTACQDEANTSKCAASIWGAPSKCTGDTPTCHEGKCLKCTPNKLTCVDNGIISKVVQCNKDGTASTDVKSGTGGTKCVGAGVCVADSPFKVGDGKSDESAPAVAALGDGFVVAWVAGDAVLARLYDSAGKATGAAIAVSATKKALAGQRIALASNGSGFAVAWVTDDAQKSHMIALRLFDKTGKALAASAFANNIDAGKQNDPTIGGWSGGWVVGWASEANDQAGTGQGIAARVFDATGKAKAVEIIVNKAVDENDDSEAGGQDQPALSCASDGTFAVAWRHDPGGALGGP